MNSRIVTRRCVTQDLLTMGARQELHTSAGGIDGLQRHPDTYFIVSWRIVQAKSLILMPRGRCTDSRWLHNGVLEASICLRTQQLLRNRQGVRAKYCLFQFGGEENRIEYLRGSVRFLFVFFRTNRL